MSETPDEMKAQARVVPRPFDSDCAMGICPHGCSHLMWVCETCSCEGGWGAPQEKLAKMAAEHVCPALSAHPDEETVSAWVRENFAVSNGTQVWAEFRGSIEELTNIVLALLTKG